MRMEINSGPVIVGSIGDDLRMDYPAVGDTTNFASRMESVAKPGTWRNGVLEKEIGCITPTPQYSSGYNAFKRQSINKTEPGHLQKDYFGHRWIADRLPIDCFRLLCDRIYFLHSLDPKIRIKKRR